MTQSIDQLIVFNLDEQRFGLRLEVVQRIERAVEVTPMPKMPESVMGIVNLKGQLVPVFNLRRRFRLPERAVDPRDQMIFAHTKRRPVALVVDSCTVIPAPAEREITPSSEILPGFEFIDGVVKTESGLILIHDLDRFLSIEEENALAEAMTRHD
jgi:purine-binding chemotaxis protein CheW